MTAAQTKYWIVSVFFVLALSITCLSLFVRLEHLRPASVRAAELSYLPNGEYLKVAVLGYRQLVADFIWLQIVQHIGIRELTTDGYLWAYHAGDVVTDLDPKFVFVYQSVGTVLSISANRPKESATFLEKGISHNPDAWFLHFLLGYVNYFDLHDSTSAAQHFRMASELPGSPAYLPQLAVKMSVKAGDQDIALEFLQRLYQQVKDEKVKQGLAERMREVIAERERRKLEAAVIEFRGRFGSLPKNLEDLVARRIIAQVPEEPFGGRYELSNDRVIDRKLQERLRLYER